MLAGTLQIVVKILRALIRYIQWKTFQIIDALLNFSKKLMSKLKRENTVSQDLFNNAKRNIYVDIYLNS